MKKFITASGLTLVFAATSPLTAQTTVVIEREGCERLVTHVPAADVSYTPGVDVNGNAVAPADLNSSPQITVPDAIKIPVDIKLADSLGIATTFDGEANVGNVVVHRDGRVTFNGQLIGDEAERELSRRCQKITR